MIELFINIITGMMFHYGGDNRKLVKYDKDHYVAPSGKIARINPYVAVIPDEFPATNSFYDQTQGESDER